MSGHGNAGCQFLDDRKSYTIAGFGETDETDETGHLIDLRKLVCPLTASALSLLEYRVLLIKKDYNSSDEMIPKTLAVHFSRSPLKSQHRELLKLSDALIHLAPLESTFDLAKSQ